MKMKKQTIFANINKRKIKRFFLYFSRKYEEHKAVFSTKETNLLGRGYRISFQKENFRYFTKKPELNYVSNFVYDNGKDRNFLDLSSNRESDSQKPVNQTTSNQANQTEKYQRTEKIPIF